MSAAKVEHEEHHHKDHHKDHHEHHHTKGANDTVQDESVEVVDERNRSYEILFALTELAIIVLFVTCTTFCNDMAVSQVIEHVQDYYPMWQDVHVMIYIGFGFLMVFLKSNSWTSVGWNFMLSAFAFQWAILCRGFWSRAMHGEFYSKIMIGVPDLINGDFCAGACMITFGALLGKADLFQMWIIVAFEVFFYALNESIGVDVFKAYDIGGSMIIHCFGAIFGLAASYFFQNREAIQKHEWKAVGGYTSQYVAMFGTIFLYLFWPSFNAALCPPLSKHRATINTALSIAVACVVACAYARLQHKALDMEIVLNATLAGGVIIGATADVIVSPGVAMAVGGFGGLISAIGFTHLQAYAREHWNLHDTCGVLSLHGMPGFFGGVISAILAAVMNQTYDSKDTLKDQFGMMNIHTTGSQCGYQFATLFVTVGIALFGGLFAGWFSAKFGRTVELLFEDGEHWNARWNGIFGKFHKHE
jgi:ammonium transporter Rh